MLSIAIGSVVTHPLFADEGVVVAVHTGRNGSPLFEVEWPGMKRTCYHTEASIQPVRVVLPDEENVMPKVWRVTKIVALVGLGVVAASLIAFFAMCGLLWSIVADKTGRH